MKNSFLLESVIVWSACVLPGYGQQIPFAVVADNLKDEYLVGEPVDLYYGICNSLAQSKLVPTRASGYHFFDIVIMRLPDENYEQGELIRFWGLRPGAGKTGYRELKPGKWHFYRLRVLYSFSLPEHVEQNMHGKERAYRQGLVFRKPGKFRVEIRQKFFRPWVPYTPSRGTSFRGYGVNFEVVFLEIKNPPAGSPEEKVWRQIRDSETLVFIQTHGEAGTPEVALKVAKILRDMPVSRYHNSLQAVLGAYYRRHWQKHSVGERALIEIALQRKFPPDEIPANRKRLLEYLRRHAPELYRGLNVKLAKEEKKPPASKLK